MQLDGCISFWYDLSGSGQAMVDCLRQAVKDGPALPEPVAEARLRGGP